MGQEIIHIDLKGVNCYLGKEGNNFVLFDTGGHTLFDKEFTNRREALENELKKAGCEPGNLKLVVLTHGDIDHVANALYLKEKYQTQLAMHADDRMLVESLSMEKMMRSFHFKSVVLKIIFQLMRQKITRISQKMMNDFQPFKPDILLREGDSLSQYGFRAKILHIPGHTAGSIGVLTDNDELICGDIFLNVKKPVTVVNADDFKTLAKSVDRLKTIQLKMIYPGHGKPFEARQLFS